MLKGAGRVDVSLEKDDAKIACEVCITSTVDYESQNILKCLAAGYDYAIAVVANHKKIPTLMEKLNSTVSRADRARAKVYSLTGLLEFLRDSQKDSKKTASKSKQRKGERLSFMEACEFFGINPSTLYRWLGQGKIPFYRPGREYQFDPDELALIGRQNDLGKRKPVVTVEPLRIEKTAPNAKKKQDVRYRKLLKLE